MHRDMSFLKKRDSFELERLSMVFSILKRMSDPKMVKDSCLRIMTSTCLLPVQRHTWHLSWSHTRGAESVSLFSIFVDLWISLGFRMLKSLWVGRYRLLFMSLVQGVTPHPAASLKCLLYVWLELLGRRVLVNNPWWLLACQRGIPRDQVAVTVLRILQHVTNTG